MKSKCLIFSLRLLLLSVVLLTWSSLGFSAEIKQAESSKAADALLGKLEKLRSMRANFKQWTVDASGSTLQKAEGIMLIKRPDLFRWQVNSPFAQVIVAKKNQVKMYDKDLEQVTIQSLTKTVDVTPALLLTGNKEQLQKNFTIQSGQTEKGSAFLLLPKRKDSVFTQLVMVFVDGKLEAMQIIDSLGAKTRILFSGIKMNGPIADSNFQLNLPEGVDVIGAMN